MRIAHVIAGVHDPNSGPSYTTIRLCEELAALGHDLELHTLAPGVASDSFHVETYPRWPLPERLGASPAMRRNLWARVSTFDIVHSSGLWMMPNTYSASAASRGDVPLVVTPHGMLDQQALGISPRRKWLMWKLRQRWAVEQATAIHATSDSEAKAIRAAGVTRPIALIPNAVDIPELQGHPTTKTVLYLGRLHRKKGLDRLVEAWIGLNGRDGWTLRIVGPDDDPGYVRHIRNMANGMLDIEFASPVTGRARTREYERAGVLVLPTDTENFGMVVAEALAAGTPAIVTRSAPWDRLPQKGCGWWVEPSAEAINAALREVMAMTLQDLDGMGLLGREWMRNEFIWRSVASKMAETYQWARSIGEEPPWIVGG